VQFKRSGRIHADDGTVFAEMDTVCATARCNISAGSGRSLKVMFLTLRWLPPMCLTNAAHHALAKAPGLQGHPRPIDFSCGAACDAVVLENDSAFIHALSCPARTGGGGRSLTLALKRFALGPYIACTSCVAPPHGTFRPAPTVANRVGARTWRPGVCLTHSAAW